MMNYTWIMDKIEQLKIGKRRVKAKKMLSSYETFTGREVSQKVLYVPNHYEEDSVGIFCESILKEHQIKTGRFTTYAVKSPVGYISYQMKNISQKKFTKIFEELFLEHLDDISNLTQIEVYFMIALRYFENNRCDYIILPDTMYENDAKFVYQIKKRSLFGQDFQTDKIDELHITSASGKDVENCVMALHLLSKEGMCLQEKKVRKALEKLKLEGRFEIIGQNPFKILDGADSKESVRNLMANLQYYFPSNPYIFILGVRKEGYEEIMKECVLLAQCILTVTPPDTQEALSGIELAKEVQKLNPNITNADSLEEALEIASLLSEKNTVIAVFGTTALLSKCKAVVSKK